MNRTRRFVIGLLIAASMGVMAAEAGAAIYRQRYSSWSYYPRRTYYYRKYYYKPYTSYTGYQYHYCIHYPSRPRYVYYYNPVQRTYWGRYDLEAKGYSMLDEKDRKGKLEEIPESAFPKPGEMPVIPGAKDNERIQKIEKDDLPVPISDDLPETDLAK